MTVEVSAKICLQKRRKKKKKGSFCKTIRSQPNLEIQTTLIRFVGLCRGNGKPCSIFPIKGSVGREKACTDRSDVKYILELKKGRSTFVLMKKNLTISSIPTRKKKKHPAYKA